MVFEKDARVQALATLFDEGTEDAQGRTYSQKRSANGLGDYCLGTVTRVYRLNVARNTVQKYMVKWDEGTSTAIDERHLAVVEGGPDAGSLGTADNESTGMSEFLTRDGEETDDENEDVDVDPTAAPDVVPEDVFAVITPVNGVVQCGEFRWRRVKAIATDPRANQPEFDFALRNMQLTEQTSLNDVLWLCMPVSRSQLLETVRYRAGGLPYPVILTLTLILSNPLSNSNPTAQLKLMTSTKIGNRIISVRFYVAYSGVRNTVAGQTSGQRNGKGW